MGKGEKEIRLKEKLFKTHSSPKISKVTGYKSHISMIINFYTLSQSIQKYSWKISLTIPRKTSENGNSLY